MQIPARQPQPPAAAAGADASGTGRATNEGACEALKGPQSRHTALFKTELCRSFIYSGRCRYSTKCQFAHGEHELRSPAQHYKFKTEPCKWYETSGACPFGDKCRFIHRGQDDGQADQQQHGALDPSRVSVEAAFAGAGFGSSGPLPGLVFSRNNQRAANVSSGAAESLMRLPLFRTPAAADSTSAAAAAALDDPRAPVSPRSPARAVRGLHGLASSSSVFSSSSDARSTYSGSSSTSSRRGSGSGEGAAAAAGASDLGRWHAPAAAGADAASTWLGAGSAASDSSDWNPIGAGFPNAFGEARVISPTPSPPQHGLGFVGAAAVAGSDSLFQAAPASRSRGKSASTAKRPAAPLKQQQPPLGVPINLASHGGLGAFRPAPVAAVPEPSAPSPMQIIEQLLAVQRQQMLLQRLRQMQEEELPRVLQWQMRELQLQQMQLQQEAAMMAERAGPCTSQGGSANLQQLLLGQQQVLF